MQTRTPETFTSALVIPNSARAHIVCAARAAHPMQACGVLLGMATQDGVQVRRVVDAQNLGLGRGPDRYELEPLALFRAERKARALGLAVVGIWHSHTDGPAQPSERDLALAWEGWSYVIVSVANGEAGELSSWRLVGGDFEEEAVIVS